MDYRAWVERALDFVENCRRLPGIANLNCDIADPLAPELLDALRRSVGDLPSPVAEFLIQGSADCSFLVAWNPQSDASALAKELLGTDQVGCGANLCPHGDLAGYFEVRSDFAESSNEWDAQLWQHSIPFLSTWSGDMLGLMPLDRSQYPDWPDEAFEEFERIGLGEMPVVLLSHEGMGSGLMARSFDDFLACWESHCYLDPTSLPTAAYDQKSRLLTVDSPVAVRIRKLFPFIGDVPQT